jgi:hypothetical protein
MTTPEPHTLTLEQYLATDPRLAAARSALDAAYAALGRDLGLRRFAGRAVGNRLDRLDRARRRFSREWDRVAARHTRGRRPRRLPP